MSKKGFFSADRGTKFASLYHIILKVEGMPCEDGQEASRRFRVSFQKGQSFKVVVWRPAQGFVPVASSFNAPPSFDDCVVAAMKVMRVVPDMINLTRICCRLEGGGREENLKQICAALGITPKTKKYNETAIECRLRALRFPENISFIPTAIHMEPRLKSDAQFEVAMQIREYQRYPGKYEKVGYTASALCSLLRSYVATQMEA